MTAQNVVGAGNETSALTVAALFTEVWASRIFAEVHDVSAVPRWGGNRRGATHHIARAVGVVDAEGAAIGPLRLAIVVAQRGLALSGVGGVAAHEEWPVVTATGQLIAIVHHVFAQLARSAVATIRLPQAGLFA